MTTHRPYESEADLSLLLGWLSRYSAHTFMHGGDLVWWLRQNTLIDPTRALELFFDDAGELQGFVFSDPVTWAVIQGAPNLPAAIWNDMVAYANSKAGGAGVVQPHECDIAQTAALLRAGYQPTDKRMRRLVRDILPADLEAVASPAGYHFADMSTGEVSAEARVGLHQAVWHPSKVTLEAYERLQAAPLYRPDLDVLVVSDTGELASYAIGWYDAAARTGLMEPVGTHADFRGRGLGKALIREITRRMAALGAEKVTIGTYESNAAAVALYTSAGYEQRGFWVDYVPKGSD